MPTIVFNTSTGSDTLSSGAGPAVAVNSTTEGTTASYSGAGPYTITFSGATDLSGVVADGSHVLYLVTSTGRKFFTIEGVNDGADTVTVTEAPAGTASGLTWAVGGKRATWDDADSRAAFNDAADDWIIETETDQSLTSKIVNDANSTAWASPIICRGSGASEKVITQTADQPVFQSTTNSGVGWQYEYLKLQNTAGTKTDANGIVSNHGSVGSDKPTRIYNCTIGDATNQLRNGLYRSTGPSYWVIEDSVVQHCTVDGFRNDASSALCYASRSRFVNNGGYGLRTGAFNGNSFSGCMFKDNGHNGLHVQAGGDTDIARCVFWGNGGSGCYITNSVLVVQSFANCLFGENTGYGIEIGVVKEVLNSNYNLFYDDGIGLGNVSGFTIGSDSLEVTVDPCTDAANNDFTLNDTAGGGAEAKSATATAFGSTTIRPFRWLDNSAGGGSSGGGPLIDGGLVL